MAPLPFVVEGLVSSCVCGLFALGFMLSLYRAYRYAKITARLDLTAAAGTGPAAAAAATGGGLALGVAPAEPASGSPALMYSHYCRWLGLAMSAFSAFWGADPHGTLGYVPFAWSKVCADIASVLVFEASSLWGFFFLSYAFRLTGRRFGRTSQPHTSSGNEPAAVSGGAGTTAGTRSPPRIRSSDGGGTSGGAAAAALSGSRRVDRAPRPTMPDGMRVVLLYLPVFYAVAGISLEVTGGVLDRYYYYGIDDLLFGVLCFGYACMLCGTYFMVRRDIMAILNAASVPSPSAVGGGGGESQVLVRTPVPSPHPPPHLAVPIIDPPPPPPHLLVSTPPQPPAPPLLVPPSATGRLLSPRDGQFLISPTAGSGAGTAGGPPTHTPILSPVTGPTLAAGSTIAQITPPATGGTTGTGTGTGTGMATMTGGFATTSAGRESAPSPVPPPSAPAPPQPVERTLKIGSRSVPVSIFTAALRSLFIYTSIHGLIWFVIGVSTFITGFTIVVTEYDQRDRPIPAPPQEWSPLRVLPFWTGIFLLPILLYVSWPVPPNTADLESAAAAAGVRMPAFGGGGGGAANGAVRPGYTLNTNDVLPLPNARRAAARDDERSGIVGYGSQTLENEFRIGGGGGTGRDRGRGGGGGGGYAHESDILRPTNYRRVVPPPLHPANDDPPAADDQPLQLPGVTADERSNKSQTARLPASAGIELMARRTGPAASDIPSVVIVEPTPPAPPHGAAR